jgi:hypothetical protein
MDDRQASALVRSSACFPRRSERVDASRYRGDWGATSRGAAPAGWRIPVAGGNTPQALIDEIGGGSEPGLASSVLLAGQKNRLAFGVIDGNSGFVAERRQRAELHDPWAMSDSAASGRARRCARTAPFQEAGLPPALPVVVRLSSERARQAVRQVCSFARKQESRPELLVVVPSGSVSTRLETLASRGEGN